MRWYIMGYDLNGLNPINESGGYFRNNVWWWIRLADFVLDNVELPSKEIKAWHSNSGQKVSEKSAIKIADFLDESLKNKKKYSEWIEMSAAAVTNMSLRIGHDYEDSKECQYPFSWSNVRKFSKFCRNSGGFEIC
jgi:hypothetical protein